MVVLRLGNWVCVRNVNPSDFFKQSALRTAEVNFAGIIMRNKLIALGFGMLMANAVNAQVIADHYIVKLAGKAQVAKTADLLANKHGLALGHIYNHAFHGFSARVPKGRLNALLKHADVASITADQVVTLNAKPCASPPCSKGDGGGGTGPDQVISTGISRINADINSVASGDGAGSVDADIAIIDTGIANHPDLNVKTGRSCLGGSPKRYRDGHGHGTHVSGIAAAKDNSIGVVGVAPGARLWAVRVLDSSGSGSFSSIICGLDYVAQNADQIEVANMSLGGAGSDGHCNDGSMREAICNTVSAGVTVVVAAGNATQDVNQFTPAGISEVITVSALTDRDGTNAGPDQIASYSNYGSGVDMIAPGSLIYSTYLNDGYATLSGTSMASPHVAGAAALYLARYPQVSPDNVKTGLISLFGSYDWDASTDRDAIQEPLLNMISF